MRTISLLILCNNQENEKIKSILEYRYDIKLITYEQNEYYKFIDYINLERPDLIILESSINNKLSILNKYKDKRDYNKTIIVDNRLECYKYIDDTYNLFNIFPSNYNSDLLHICLDIIGKQNYENNIPLYQRINTILNKTNLPNNKIGYKYIRKAIYELFQDPSLTNNFNRKLYPLLSKTYHKSISSIEKAIRSSINSATININDEYNNKLFSKYMTYDKTTPTTQEFILTIVDKLLLEYGKITH